jgi:hypothetical protein
MKIDIYTKAVLTVIAVSLSAIASQMAIGSAYAAGGVTKVEICDKNGYCAEVNAGHLMVKPW